MLDAYQPPRASTAHYPALNAMLYTSLYHGLAALGDHMTRSASTFPSTLESERDLFDLSMLKVGMAASDIDICSEYI